MSETETRRNCENLYWRVTCHTLNCFSIWEWLLIFSDGLFWATVLIIIRCSKYMSRKVRNGCPDIGIYLPMPHSSNCFSHKIRPPKNLYNEWQILGCHFFHNFLWCSLHMGLATNGLTSKFINNFMLIQNECFQTASTGACIFPSYISNFLQQISQSV